MLNRSFVDRHSRIVLDRLPSWLPWVVVLLILTRVIDSFAGTDDDTATALSTIKLCFWYLATFLAVGLVSFGVCSLRKTCLNLWETWRESQNFVERIWTVAIDGPGSAALVGEDLGKPDRNGVYTRQSATGSKLYFRMARGSMSGDKDFKVWQWSFDKRSWTPTAKVDRFWSAKNPCVAGMADKILIRRLEIESAFREKHPCLNSSIQTPAIDLRFSKEEEKERLMKSVPKGYLCPISMELMTEPVVSPSGITYDRKSITNWINLHRTDPATQAPLRLDHLYPNLALRDMIQEWLVVHDFIGTENIYFIAERVSDSFMHAPSVVAFASSFYLLLLHFDTDAITKDYMHSLWKLKSKPRSHGIIFCGKEISKHNISATLNGWGLSLMHKLKFHGRDSKSKSHVHR